MAIFFVVLTVGFSLTVRTRYRMLMRLSKSFWTFFKEGKRVFDLTGLPTTIYLLNLREPDKPVPACLGRSRYEHYPQHQP